MLLPDPLDPSIIIKICYFFLISYFPPKNFIIFKNDGDDVLTVSKFLISEFIPVNKDNIDVDIQIL